MTSAEAFKKYGEPVNGSRHLTVFDVPTELEIGYIPKKIYCNKDIVEPLMLVFIDLIQTGLVKEIKSWDGCFNIRPKRTSKSMSLHSWGLAVDINAFENPMGQPCKFSKPFLSIWRKHGFECGADWSYPDGMHFQLK